MVPCRRHHVYFKRPQRLLVYIAGQSSVRTLTIFQADFLIRVSYSKGSLCLSDRFLSFLSPQDLVAVSRLDRASNVKLRVYFRRMFTIDCLLAPFLSHVNDFRVMQSRTGALISGSTALQLFNRDRYAEADLDVYVEGRYAVDVVNHLLECETYEFQPKPTQYRDPSDTLAMNVIHPKIYDSYLVTGITGVLTFIRGDKQIQVIVSCRSPLDVVFNFHSSVLSLLLCSHGLC